MSLAEDGILSACWEATQPYFLFLYLLSPLVSTCAFIFTFIFSVCIDVCSYFSISFIDAKEKRTSKKEIQPQENSTNEEKNATNANTS